MTMQIKTHCMKPKKQVVYVIFQDKYDCTVIGTASSFAKAENLAKQYNEEYKEFDPEVDLIAQKDLWIEEFPLDELIEL